MNVKRGSRIRDTSKDIFNSKRAQVTIFIIAGIIVLFAFAGVLYITKTTVKQTISTEGEPIISEAPQEFQPLQSFTENCLTQMGKRGLQILGQQGGYIYPEVLGDFSANDPTNSVGVSLEPAKVPYWYYNPEPNQGNKVSISSLRPELTGSSDLSVENQLARFVQEKIDTCLGSYKAFTDQGFKMEFKEGKEDKKVEVKVTDNSVNFWLKMNLNAERGSSKITFDQFYVKVPLKLKHYYELAGEITTAEKTYGFLEHQLLGMIDVFSAPDRDKLPPKQDVTFNLVSTTFWPVEDVKIKLKSILSSYVPLLQMQSAHNIHRYEYPAGELKGLFQQNYDNMIVPLGGANDVEVRFDYFGWEPYINVNDQKETIKSQDTFMEPKWGLTPAIGIQRYYTTYDLSYPVLVSVDDPLAFDGEGYQFVFALESNVRNNERVEAEEILPPPITLAKNSIACNDNQKNTAPLKTLVVDSYSGEPLEMVRVGFSIPDQDECTLGLTNNKGELEAKYPAVYGGIMNFIKEDYLTDYYPIDTYNIKDKTNSVGYALAEDGQPTIEMHQFKTINVSVMKSNLGKCIRPLVCQYTYGTVAWYILPIPYKEIKCSEGREQCFFNTGVFALPAPVATINASGSLTKFNDYYFLNGKAQPLRDEEQALITLTRVRDLKEGVFNPQYAATFDVSGKNTAGIKLVPGVYEVRGLLTLNQPVKIPEDKRSIKMDIPMWDKDMQFKMNETNFDKYIEGMLVWDNEKTYLTITPDDLYNSQELTLTILSQNILSVPEKIKTIEKECGSVVCIPGVGCQFAVCNDKEIEINARVLEDTQLMGMMANISQLAEVRSALEPVFK